MRTTLASEQGPEEEEKEQSTGCAQDIAVFPLATPLIAGPGAILAVVLLTDNEQFGFVEQAQTTLLMLAVLAITYVVLLAAGAIQRIRGEPRLGPYTRGTLRRNCHRRNPRVFLA